MGYQRVFCDNMVRLSTFRSYQIVLVFGAALAVVAFYYFGSEQENFSSTTKRIKQTQTIQNSNRNEADPSVDPRLEQTSRRTAREQLEQRRAEGGSEAVQHYHILMMFTKVDKSKALQEKFEIAMRSMVKHARFLDKEMLVFHFVSDEGSRELGQKILPEFLQDASFQYEVSSRVILRGFTCFLIW